MALAVTPRAVWFGPSDTSRKNDVLVQLIIWAYAGGIPQGMDKEMGLGVTAKPNPQTVHE